MRYAIISVSAEGARLGLRLKATLKGDITLYEHQECASGAEANYFKKTAALTSEIFGRYDGLIYIMAAGIVVRSIAAHVVSKASDPAVLCMDEWLSRLCFSDLPAVWIRRSGYRGSPDP